MIITVDEYDIDIDKVLLAARENTDKINKEAFEFISVNGDTGEEVSYILDVFNAPASLDTIIVSSKDKDLLYIFKKHDEYKATLIAFERDRVAKIGDKEFNADIYDEYLELLSLSGEQTDKYFIHNNYDNVNSRLILKSLDNHSLDKLIVSESPDMIVRIAGFRGLYNRSPFSVPMFIIEKL